MKPEKAKPRKFYNVKPLFVVYAVTPLILLILKATVRPGISFLIVTLPFILIFFFLGLTFLAVAAQQYSDTYFPKEENENDN